jgi:hypothetical protein
MIFYQAIKYQLIDYCLDALFEGLFRNLKKFPNTMTSEKVELGMHFSRMIYTNIDNQYYKKDLTDVLVTEIFTDSQRRKWICVIGTRDNERKRFTFGPVGLSNWLFVI